MSVYEKYQNDFNNLSDSEIEYITREEQDKLNEAEEWLEAVAAWEADGKPRTNKDATQ